MNFTDLGVRYMDEDEEGDGDDAAAFKEESLLDLAKVHYQGVHLTYHYRSIYEELIQFSNNTFYGGRLKISPNTSCYSSNNRPIERRMVNGCWIDNENREEAEEVVHIISELFKTRKHHETIGIITFNVHQRTCIENALEKRAQEDEAFKAIYIK